LTYTSLYRFYDDNEVLLYAGITNSLSHRLAQHEASKHWWRAVTSVTVEHYDTRAEAEAEEQKAIREELPVWNIAHQPKVPLLDRLAVMRPYLVDVLETIHHETQRARTDPSWCFYEVWYQDGLRQRAKFALLGETLPVESSDFFGTLDDFLDSRPPLRAQHAHEEWLDQSWGRLAEVLMELLPSCGPDCEHYEPIVEWEPF
jgi:predicted GIY-YIG superfamily endonuclease